MAPVGDSVSFPVGACFFPDRKPPLCWEWKRNPLIYIPCVRASGCPGSQAPVTPHAPALAGEVSSPGTRPRGGMARPAGMLSAGRELEISGRAGSQPRQGAKCRVPAPAGGQVPPLAMPNLRPFDRDFPLVWRPPAPLLGFFLYGQPKVRLLEVTECF